MGYMVNDESNPFCPKRFRSLFRTACGIDNVESGYVMAMMGHSSNISATYLEKSNGLFLKEYLKVEPYVTMYGVDKSQITLINENYDDLKIQLAEVITKQQNDKEELVKQISSTYKFVHKTYDPDMDLLNKLSNIPEAESLLKTARYKIQADNEKKLGK